MMELNTRQASNRNVSGRRWGEGNSCDNDSRSDALVGSGNNQFGESESEHNGKTYSSKIKESGRIRSCRQRQCVVERRNDHSNSGQGICSSGLGENLDNISQPPPGTVQDVLSEAIIDSIRDKAGCHQICGACNTERGSDKNVEVSSLIEWGH